MKFVICLRCNLGKRIGTFGPDKCGISRFNTQRLFSNPNLNFAMLTGTLPSSIISIKTTLLIIMYHCHTFQHPLQLDFILKDFPYERNIWFIHYIKKNNFLSSTKLQWKLLLSLFFFILYNLKCIISYGMVSIRLELLKFCNIIKILFKLIYSDAI